MNICGNTSMSYWLQENVPIKVALKMYEKDCST